MFVIILNKKNRVTINIHERGGTKAKICVIKSWGDNVIEHLVNKKKIFKVRTAWFSNADWDLYYLEFRMSLPRPYRVFIKGAQWTFIYFLSKARTTKRTDERASATDVGRLILLTRVEWWWTNYIIHPTTPRPHHISKVTACYCQHQTVRYTIFLP